MVRAVVLAMLAVSNGAAVSVPPCGCWRAEGATERSEILGGLLGNGVVFSGRVVALSIPSAAVASACELEARGRPIACNRVTVDFEVMEAWKGVNTPLFSIKTSAWGSDCSFAFELGGRYLVYAPGIPEPRRDLPLVTICTRTRLLEEAALDLSVLGDPEYIAAEDA